MYNDSVNGGMFNGRDLEELPEAVGPVVQLQEKLYVPVKEYPDVSAPPFTFRKAFCLLLAVVTLSPPRPVRLSATQAQLFIAARFSGPVTSSSHQKNP